MTTLLLIRHGNTETVGQALSGKSADMPLNERGRADVRRLAELLKHLNLAAVYTSPLQRTRESAQIVGQSCGLVPKVVEDLTDVDFGPWAGRPLSELHHDEAFRAFNRHRSLAGIPGGEPMIQVQARMVRECLRIADVHDGQTVAMVGHMDPLRLLLGYFLGMPLDFTIRMEIAPASLTALHLTAGSANLLCANWMPGELVFH